MRTGLRGRHFCRGASAAHRYVALLTTEPRKGLSRQSAKLRVVCVYAPPAAPAYIRCWHITGDRRWKAPPFALADC